jgi:hypothetical protein
VNEDVRELVIDLFVPKWTSTFFTQEFRQFLSRLETATLSILSLHDMSGEQTNTTLGFVEFLCNLNVSFFHHMDHVEYLHINTGDPLGLSGKHHIPLALQPGDLPLLRSLKLERCFVCPELVSFIRGHAKVLKSLDIEGCDSAADGPATASFALGSLYWAEFLDQVYEAKPSLTHLVAGSGSELLAPGADPSLDFDSADEAEDIKDIRRQLAADPELKLFRYAFLDDQFGMFFHNDDQNVKQFVKGNDWRAYRRLMGLVNENAARERAAMTHQQRANNRALPRNE